MKRDICLTEQDLCDHEFEYLCGPVKKTKEGYYKDEKDYEEGMYFTMYACIKCSKLVSVDFSKDDITPMIEFEEKNRIRRR